MSLSFCCPAVVVACAVSRASDSFSSASLIVLYRRLSSSCRFLTASAALPDCCSSVASPPSGGGGVPGSRGLPAWLNWSSLIGAPFLSKNDFLPSGPDSEVVAVGVFRRQHPRLRVGVEPVVAAGNSTQLWCDLLSVVVDRGVVVTDLVVARWRDWFSQLVVRADQRCCAVVVLGPVLIGRRIVVDHRAVLGSLVPSPKTRWRSSHGLSVL